MSASQAAARTTPQAAPRTTPPAARPCLANTPGRLAVRTNGTDAERWLGIAQAFAGPPGPGRPAKGGGR
ncbi:hypothetical protein [Streptomyces sp. NPDC055099]